MKTLLVVRHAKSSWADFSLSDFDRPLNDRGKTDGPEMAARMKDKGIKIDLFVSSPAKRAKRTARYFAEEYGVKKDDIKLIDTLYEAPVSAFEKVVEGLPSKADTVALFSHNPGITDFVNTLTNTRIDNMPTCCVFAVQADVKDWGEFKAAGKKFLFFDFPKNVSY